MDARTNEHIISLICSNSQLEQIKETKKLNLKTNETMNYNLERHIDLLKFENTLRSKFGPNALRNREPDFYSELLKYSLELSDHLHWTNRQQYFNFMNDFVNLFITGLQFEKSFQQKFREVESLVDDFQKNPERLKTISLDPNSKNFSRWISDVSEYCDEFDPNFDPADIVYPFTKDESAFRNAIESILPEMEKYLKS